MSNLEMGVAAGAALAGLIAVLWLRGLLKRKLSGKADGAGRTPANGADAPLIERRVSAVERAQAEIVGRLDDMAETGAPEERMQAMASSLVGLIQDKNASMETALAGLDQLRARLGTLEKIGDMAEARALFDGLTERLEALETGRKEAEAAFGTRLAALTERLEGDGGPAAALGAKLARLHEQKDAGLAAMMVRIEPLEKRLGLIETGMKALPAEAAGRVEGRIGEIARLQSDVQAELAALKARAESATAPFAEISEQLTRLYAQKDSTTEAMLARLAPLEAKLAELETGLRDVDPRAALDRFAERLAESEARLTGEIETLKSAENPFAEISDQLTRLYAQKDSTTEAMLARLAPLEAKLAELETGLRAADPRAALDRFAERLAASEAAHGADHARLSGEIETLKSAENPFAEISDQLTRLYAQKDSTTEAMLARLAPLEAKLAELETGLREADPRAALDRFAERLAASEAAHGADHARLTGEIETLKSAENPFAEISDQLTRLYAQKDSTTEAMLARLAPLEAKLAELETGLREADPRAALDRFAERLAASEAAHGADHARLTGEIETLKSAENPFAEISDQLTRLYAQKDSTTEAMLARLAPLEAKLAELETGLRDADPRAALDRFAERLAASEAAHGADHARLTGEIETLKSAENPFAEISDQLTRLYAQKDSTTEAMLARLAPLEAKLAELETGLRDADPRAALDRFAERLAASEAAHGADHARLTGEIETLKSAENPFAEISDQLTRLYAQKDSTTEAMLARLAPLEAKLAELETGLRDADPRAALDRFAERLAASEAAHGADHARLTGEIETLKSAENPFAEISDQLTRLYAQKDAVVEAMLARLAPVEAKLAEMEKDVAAKDPQAAIERFAERLAASEARLSGEIETLKSAENPFAEISDQLTRLYAQKDGTVAAMLARLAPLEAKLGALETEMGARDPQAAITGLAERIERLQDGQGDLTERLAAASAAALDPQRELSERVAELAARADAASEEIAGRIAPLAERLAALETRGIEDEDAARAEAEEIAEQLIAMREAAERTALFADRIAMLETSLPRLTMAQSLMMEALERRSADGSEPDAAEGPAAPPEAAETTPDATPEASATPETEDDAVEEIDDIWNIPRVVSMHQG